jgi:hypothetical protein
MQPQNESVMCAMHTSTKKQFASHVEDRHNRRLPFGRSPIHVSLWQVGYSLVSMSTTGCCCQLASRHDVPGLQATSEKICLVHQWGKLGHILKVTACHVVRHRLGYDKTAAPLLQPSIEDASNCPPMQQLPPIDHTGQSLDRN